MPQLHGSELQSRRRPALNWSDNCTEIPNDSQCDSDLRRLRQPLRRRLRPERACRRARPLAILRAGPRGEPRPRPRHRHELRWSRRRRRLFDRLRAAAAPPRSSSGPVGALLRRRPFPAASAFPALTGTSSINSVGTPQVPSFTLITRVPGLRPGRTSETSTPAATSRARAASASGTRQDSPQSRSKPAGRGARSRAAARSRS